VVSLAAGLLLQAIEMHQHHRVRVLPKAAFHWFDQLQE
jgi:hypothetical protein